MTLPQSIPTPYIFVFFVLFALVLYAQYRVVLSGSSTVTPW